MLSQEAVSYLATRTYRPDAAREIKLIPLSGIYWEDEYPFYVGEDAVSQGDYQQVLRMFALRACLWRGEVLSPEQQEFWDEIYAQVPTWALFKRMEISAEDLQAQNFATQTMDDFEAAVIAEADSVEFFEDGGFRAELHLDPEANDDGDDN